MLPWVKSWFLLLLAAMLLSGCSEIQPGTVSIVFEWLDGEPTFENEVFVWAKVERRDATTGNATRVSESDVLSYTPAVQLNTGQIPNGNDYVLVVEIKEAADKESFTLYYGESDTSRSPRVKSPWSPCA